MKTSPETSPRAGRTRLVALLTAVPLVVLAFAVYALSGLHAEADAGSEPVSETVVPAAAIPPAANAAPTTLDVAPVMSQHDAELLAYRPHGG